MGGRGSGRPQGGAEFIPAPDREPYERQPEESAKAWNAFQKYLDMGHLRTQAKVRAALGKTEGYRRVIEEWSVRWGWAARCRTWEAEQDAARRAEELKAIRQMHKRHIQLGTALTGLAATELQKLLKKAQEESEESSLTTAAIIRLVEAGAKLETRSYGEPEELTRQEITNAPDAGPFRTEIVFVKPDDKG
ncbi:MAG: hypothetical protein KAJ19_13665 [Gammaproteobacteria bacterium]|nr:hypothetical protein [Gammaproteobacteria bacterium]